MTDRLYVRMDVVISYDIDPTHPYTRPGALDNLEKVRDDLKQEITNLLNDELDGEIMDNLVLKTSVYVDTEPYL